jgi:Zn-dependent protease
MAVRSPAFHLFGFPIHVRMGFVLFVALIIMVNGGEFGLWLAGSAAVLTLLHELGHAFAARATGARAEISLDFLAGYASFVPTRPLKRWERAGISVAGPAVQIGVSMAALFALGVDPFDPDSFGDSAASFAIWFTGPVMGMLNLIPVLPLDGGHIVQAGLDKLMPGRAHKPMLWFSLVVTSVGAVAFFLTPDLRGLAFFVVFPLMVQLQMLFAGRPDTRVQHARNAAERGEAMAWATGEVTAIPPQLVPSPWFRAHQQLQSGQPDVAREVLLADLADTSPPNWWPPNEAPERSLEQLVALLPRPLPLGRSYSEHALADVLVRLGAYDDAASYGAASFQRHRSTASALAVARSAAALGDVEVAIGWLRAAYRADTDPGRLVDAMDDASEFDVVRTDPRFVELRTLLE